MTNKIHFTNTFEKLSSILESRSFMLKYCNEIFDLGDKRVSTAVHPMVSFSDYSFNHLSKKTITYGKYAIAFSKSWIARKRIHKIMYIDKDSLLAESLASLLVARRLTEKEKGLPPNVRLSIMQIKCFTKNSVGFNSYLKKKNFNFQKEREWRYVPSKSQIDGNLISQTRSVYNKKPEYYNNLLRPYPLRFNLGDVSRVYVVSESERNFLHEAGIIDRSKIYFSNWKE